MAGRAAPLHFTMLCPVAEAFVDEYARAATEHSKAVHTLSNLAGSHREFEAAKRHVEVSSAKAKAAHEALQGHYEDHGCREWSRRRQKRAGLFGAYFEAPETTSPEETHLEN